jgi:hypothetical protein
MPTEPKDLMEYKTDHDLLIELRTLVLIMNQQLEKMTANFVTQEEFWPVKVLVYGCVGLMLTSIIGSLLFLVLKASA